MGYNRSNLLYHAHRWTTSRSGRGSKPWLPDAHTPLTRATSKATARSGASRLRRRKRLPLRYALGHVAEDCGVKRRDGTSRGNPIGRAARRTPLHERAAVVALRGSASNCNHARPGSRISGAQTQQMPRLARLLRARNRRRRRREDRSPNAAPSRKPMPPTQRSIQPRMRQQCVEPNQPRFPPSDEKIAATRAGDAVASPTRRSIRHPFSAARQSRRVGRGPKRRRTTWFPDQRCASGRTRKRTASSKPIGAICEKSRAAADSRTTTSLCNPLIERLRELRWDRCDQMNPIRRERRWKRTARRRSIAASRESPRAQHHLAIGQHVAAADLVDSALPRHRERGDQVGEHIANADWLATRRHPARRDHDWKALR